MTDELFEFDAMELAEQIKKGFVEPKIQGAENFIYWGYRDSYNSSLFRLLIIFKNLIKKVFFIK